MATICSNLTVYRALLQSCYFPPTYHDVEAGIRLKPGDTRTWTGLKVFIELRDGVTLHVPFREASKVNRTAPLRQCVVDSVGRTGNGTAR